MKTCLVVIYNHNYAQNIPIINKIYAGRFASIKHVIPFAQDDFNVIGVFESSYQFSGYIAQAYSRIVSNEFARYMFVADDVLLSPVITEETLESKFGVGAYIDDLSVVNSSDLKSWKWAMAAEMNFRNGGNACEGMRFLPTYEEACALVSAHGLSPEDAPSEEYYTMALSAAAIDPDGCYRIRIPRSFKQEFRHRHPLSYWGRKLWGRGLDERDFFPQSRRLYPFLRSWSDIVIVPADKLRQFAFYCGVFASMRVFAEMAIPTALAFVCPKIITRRKLGYKAIVSGEAADKIRGEMVERYDGSLKRLLDNFPDDLLFVHPVKLSQWRTHE